MKEMFSLNFIVNSSLIKDSSILSAQRISVISSLKIVENYCKCDIIRKSVLSQKFQFRADDCFCKYFSKKKNISIG